jgi:hypothetical protein
MRICSQLLLAAAIWPSWPRRGQDFVGAAARMVSTGLANCNAAAAKCGRRKDDASIQNNSLNQCITTLLNLIT